MKRNYTKLLVMIVLFSSSATFAQDYITSIKNHLSTNRTSFGVLEEDVQDLRISDEVFNKNNKVTHVYAMQQVQGIPIYNAIVNAAFKDGVIFYVSETLEASLASRATTSTPTLNPIQGATSAAQNLGLGAANFNIESAVSTQEFILDTGGVSLEKVPVRLVYMPTAEGALRLAWDLSIHTKDQEHWWSVRIDAATGELLSKTDWILSCTFGTHDHKTSAARTVDSAFSLAKNVATAAPLSGEQYNVYALPVESPIHGQPSIVVNPQNEVASPFGWHDTDGVEGAEFTITRGNNVWAQEDQNTNNGVGDSPDGGEDLIFDFPYDLETSPQNIVDATTTNLFYLNNVIHDIFYLYGFDEASGNFQENNYTGEGLGSDSVNADSQDGFSLNNARFFSVPEGSNPRMEMFLWSATGEAGNSVTVNGGALDGSYIGVPASFGGTLPEEDAPITANLVLVDDEVGDTVDACDPLTNGTAISGNIAVIRRGACEFGFKVLAAENEGAIAVIVVNNVADTPISMGGGDFGADVSIPSVMMTQADGENIISALENGDTVNVSIVNAGPYQKDGNLDNGIVVHEYGHGISNRLTGGAATTGCLDRTQQLEQPGEGWSDYFGLMLTMKEGDTAEQGRGVGTYVQGQDIDGPGIRPARYSTDTSINSLTYGDTNNEATISLPHGIGTVWATALWDMTWAFIDQYGFNEDLYNGTGGNNIALQLVIDGLKLQPCLPGFVDGREAILAAVDINDAFTTAQERANAKCTIYTAFAARGIGFSASQGSRLSRTDQVEAFDFPPGDDNPCNFLAVADASSVNFSVFPNPSNGEININVGRNVGEGVIKIFDINGREVFSSTKTLEGTVRVQASDLATGIYLLNIQNDSVSQTTKIVIN